MLKKYISAIICTIIVAMTCSPAVVFAQPPAETADASAAVKPKPDLDYITPDAAAGLVVFPRAILTSAAFEALPIEVLSAGGKRDFGIDPVQIEQAIAIAEPPAGGPPGAVVVLKMTGPIGSDRILPHLWGNTTEDTLDGKAYRKGKGPMDPSIYQPDEKTLIVGIDAILRKVVAVHTAPAPGKLKTMLGRGGSPDLMCVVLIEPLRPIIAAGMMMAPPLPPQLANVRNVPNLVQYIGFKADLTDRAGVVLTVRANDEAAAEQLGGIVDNLIAMGQQAADAEVARQEASRDPVEQATAKYSKRMSRLIAEMLRPKRKGATLTTAISPEAIFPPPTAEMTAGLAEKKPDLDYITPDASAVAILFLQNALKRSPLAQYLPLEILSAAGKQELGLDPVEIEQAIGIAEAPSGPTLANMAAVLKMAAPIKDGPILGPLWDETTEGNLNGKMYRKAKRRIDFSIYQVDKKTLIVGTDEMLRKVVAAHAAPADCRLKTMLRRGGSPDLMAVMLTAPFRGKTEKAQLPPQLAVANELPNLVDYFAFKANLSEPVDVMFSVRAIDDAAADRVQRLFNMELDLGRQMAETQMSVNPMRNDPLVQAQAQYFKRLFKRMTDALQPVRKGPTMTWSHSGGNSVAQAATIGILAGLLLPAVQSGREAARRANALNNTKQIMLAMNVYNAAKGTFPPQAVCDAQGKPLLSWRVSILPYIDQEALYKQFHLDEPWDSPHNKPLIAMMPSVYKNPSSASAKPGRANYLAVCGAGLMFDGTKGRKLTEITDGTSNTIAVVEADDARAVQWTKPQDWEFDDKQPMAGLGHAHPPGFCAGFADGSVHFIPASVDATLFKGLLTIAGGEAVMPP